MPSNSRYWLLLCLLGIGEAAVAAENDVVRGYAGIGATRFSFQEEDFPDAEPLSATVFAGVELHRFLDVQVQISIPVESDKYSEPMSLMLHDYLGRSFDLSSVGSVNIKTEIPLSAAFYVKPKADIGPVQLYVLAGAAYTKLEQQMDGRFDVDVMASDGAVLGSFANLPWEIQYEREGVSLAYGAGLALSLGKLRLHGEYIRVDKRDATNHACHTSGNTGSQSVVYCDDLFNSSTLDTATVGLAINF
ncbi:MAG: outer membrane beta-barrel protein [Moraxellaceae bacterium]